MNGVSKGYLFAANLENPGLMTVFESLLANPVANKRLTELLKKAAEGKSRIVQPFAEKS